MYLFRQLIPTASLYLIVHLPGVVSAQSKIGIGGFSAKSLSRFESLDYLAIPLHFPEEIHESSSRPGIFPFSFSFSLPRLYLSIVDPPFTRRHLYHAFCKNRIPGPAWPLTLGD
ncbi:hypothetical protein BDV28DRAFT_29310 [Aspergillus coremiiformis]|uniref:Secreted protein n=1 Tax=Aspergillus coremiiformis TaxID=138285 RepID=A0A5N6Z1U2_9EURO|nr:hypothetical protein BDV28DRAFT_29310 [Aspergillus coremiiformis]